MSDWISNTGEEAYRIVCHRSANFEAMFRMFKKNAIFYRIVGVDTNQHCFEMYNRIKKSPAIFASLDKFLANDKNSPPLLTITADGKQIGMDTIRFAESVALINEHLGDLKGKTIAEFGSNYGGLCYCMNTQWPEIAKYHLIDLPEVNELARMYLSMLNIDAYTLDLPTSPVDLFISEYALTEMYDEPMYRYFDKYAKDAKILYLRVNLIEKDRELKFIDYIKQSFDVVLQEKETLCRRPNQIVIAKHK